MATSLVFSCLPLWQKNWELTVKSFVSAVQVGYGKDPEKWHASEPEGGKKSKKGISEQIKKKKRKKKEKHQNKQASNQERHKNKKSQREQQKYETRIRKKKRTRNITRGPEKLSW